MPEGAVGGWVGVGAWVGRAWLAFGVTSVVAQISLDYARYVSVLKWLTLSLFTYVGALAFAPETSRFPTLDTDPDTADSGSEPTSKSPLAA